MRNPKSPTLRPLAGATAVLLVLSAISFIVLREQPAGAAHSNATINVLDTAEAPAAANNAAVQWEVVANDDQFQAVPGLVILAEIEGGPNDPDGADATGGSSYGTPDLTCTTTSTGSCVLQFTPYALTVTPSVVRIWIRDGFGIDTNEQLIETASTSAGCAPEPDGTEVVNFTSTSNGGTAPPAAGPGTNPNPTTCPADGTALPTEHASGSPTPTGSTTATPTGSTTATPTGSTTATPTGSTTATPTGSTTATPTGSTTATPTGSTTATPTGSTTATPTGSTTATPTGSTTPSPTGSGAPANITIAVTPELGTYGTDFTIQGDVTCNGAPVANQEVLIAYQHMLDPPPTFFIATDTNAAGHYSETIPDLISSSQFIALWEGNDVCPDGAISGVDIGRVRPGIIVNPSSQTRTAGQIVTITGKVIPNHAGSKVYLMLLQGATGTYRIVGEAKLDGSGNYTLKYRMSGSEFLVFTVGWPTQHRDHVWNIGRNVRVN